MTKAALITKSDVKRIVQGAIEGAHAAGQSIKKITLAPDQTVSIILDSDNDTEDGAGW